MLPARFPSCRRQETVLVTNVASLMLEAGAVSLSVKNILGEGSFGVVYHGNYDGNSVAVKGVHNNCQEARTQFHREVRRYIALRHPNICQFYGLLPAANFPFASGDLLLVTEFCSGGSVYAALREVRVRNPTAAGIPQQTLFAIASGATSALYYLHSRGYCHGDIKTQNLLLSHSGDLTSGRLHPSCAVKLCDFGVSRRLNTHSSSCEDQTVLPPHCSFRNAAKPFSGKGSYAYMSPEAFSTISNDDVDVLKAVDIYALGTVLYELLTLQIPWKGKSSWQIFNCVVKNGSRPHWPETMVIANDWKQLVERCWSADPRLRPTAEQASSEISRINSTVCGTGGQVESCPTHSLSSCSFIFESISSAPGSPVANVEEVDLQSSRSSCSTNGAGMEDIAVPLDLRVPCFLDSETSFEVQQNMVGESLAPDDSPFHRGSTKDKIHDVSASHPACDHVVRSSAQAVSNDATVSVCENRVEDASTKNTVESGCTQLVTADQSNHEVVGGADNVDTRKQSSTEQVQSTYSPLFDMLLPEDLDELPPDEEIERELEALALCEDNTDFYANLPQRR